jgi:hypothetical protein
MLFPIVLMLLAHVAMAHVAMAIAGIAIAMQTLCGAKGQCCPSTGARAQRTS